MKEEDKIDLKSEEFQEILEAPPHWILRTGITILSIIIVILLAGSAFFKYPDVINTEITLTGSVPPASIVSKTSGRLDTICVCDNQAISKGDYLAIITNPANTKDILYLKKYLNGFDINNAQIEQPLKNLSLGGIQSLFSSFYTTLFDFEQFRNTPYYADKIKFMEARIVHFQKQHADAVVRNKLINERLAIARKQFVRDSNFKNHDIISPKEYEDAHNRYLQECISYENTIAATDNLKIETEQTKESLLDTKQQYTDKKNEFLLQINSYITQIQTAIYEWEMNYVLASPIDGKTSFSKYWVKNQNISGEEEIFNIIPQNAGNLLGKAFLPIERSGKVRIGQKVNIRFDNFPDTEYGSVKGEVRNISLVPSTTKDVIGYVVDISFPEELITTYGTKLPYLPNMKGQADIITDDITLLTRFIMPLKKLWNNGIK